MPTPHRHATPSGRTSSGTRSLVIARVGVQGVNAVLGSAAALLMARYLGPEGRGVLALVMSAAFLAAALGTLGLNEAAPYLRNQRHVPGGQLLQIMAAASLPAGALAGAICGGLVWSRLDGGLPSTLLSTLVAGWVFARVWNLSVKGVVVAGGDLQAANLSDMVDAGLPALGLLAACAAGIVTPPRVMALYLTGTALSAFMLTRAARRRASAEAEPAVHCGIAEALSYSWRAQVRMAAFVVAQRLDIFLVGVTGGPVLAGIYAAAKAVPELLARVGEGAAWVTLPLASRLAASDARAETTRTLRVTLTVTVLAACTAALTAPMLVAMLFGPEFAGAADPMRLLLPGTCAAAVTSVVGAHLVGRGRAGCVAASMWGGVAALAATWMALSPVAPSIAVPIGVSAGQAITAVALLRAWKEAPAVAVPVRGLS